MYPSCNSTTSRRSLVEAKSREDNTNALTVRHYDV